MSFAASTPIGYCLSGYRSAASCEQPVLELRLRYFHRVISVPPFAGVPYLIIQETAPTPLNNLLLPLPLNQLHDPMFFQIYIVQLLSSLSIHAVACEVIAQHIASCIIQMVAGNRGTNVFHIVAVVDYIREITWMEPIHGFFRGWSNGGALVEETVVLEEAPAAMEKLEENNGEEEFGDCSICLDELNCKKSEVTEIPCGHVYHESCIFKWLHNSNSCPLCRRPVSLKD